MAAKAERDLSIAAEGAKSAHKAVGAALALLQARKIWLSKELAERVEKLLVGGLLSPALTYHYYAREKLSDDDVIRSVALWNEAKAEVRQLLADIEGEFRSLLTSVEGAQ